MIKPAVALPSDQPSRSADRPLTMLGLSARNLYRQPVRTVLTSLGVSIGVVAIVAFTSLVRGMWRAVDSSIHINDSDLVVFQSKSAADILSVLDEHAIEIALRSEADIADAWPELFHVMPIDNRPFMMTIGLRPRDVASRYRSWIAAGGPIESDLDIMLGTMAADVFKKTVGDTLNILGVDYRVAGIFKSDIIFYNGAVMMSLAQMQRMLGKDGRVSLFFVQLREGADAGLVGNRLEENNPDLVAIREAGEYEKVDQGLAIANAMVWAVSFLALVIGGVIVLNTMWMAVNERTREIGVLRAVGWSRRGIMSLIIVESAGVGLMGCAVGSLLGIGLAEATTLLPTVQRFTTPEYGLRPFGIALAVAVILSVVGGLAPAWRAARVSPVEALRYE